MPCSSASECIRQSDGLAQAQFIARPLERFRFITQHHDTITVQGSTVQASDSTIQAQLNEKLATLNTREQAAQSAYQALQALVAGN